MARGKSGGDRNGVIAFTTTQTPKVGGDVLHTLEAASKTGGGQTPCVLAYNSYQRTVGNVASTIRSDCGGALLESGVLAFHHTQTPISGTVSPAIGGTTDGMGVLSFYAKMSQSEGDGNGIAQTLKASDNPVAVICTTGDITHALTHKGADAGEDGTGRGTPIVVDVVGTLDFGGHGGSYNGQDAYSGRILPSGGRPRRLTPLECERLMSWPDQWTATGRKDDGTEYALSDTARYRLCGNGVGSVCAEWIGRRLMAAITAQGAA